jgi:hypothetical protein
MYQVAGIGNRGRVNPRVALDLIGVPPASELQQAVMDRIFYMSGSDTGRTLSDWHRLLVDAGIPLHIVADVEVSSLPRHDAWRVRLFAFGLKFVCVFSFFLSLRLR